MYMYITIYAYMKMWIILLKMTYIFGNYPKLCWAS